MLTRRRFVRNSAVTSAALAACPPLLRQALGQAAASANGQPLRLAVLGNTYRLGSHFQTLGDRFLVGYPFEGEWHTPAVQVVSMYVDQRTRIADARPNEFSNAMTGTRIAYGGANQRPGGAGGQRAGGAPGAAGAAGAQRQRGEGGGQGGQRAGGRGGPMLPLEPPAPGADLAPYRAQDFNFRVYPNVQNALRCGGDRIAVDAVLSICEQSEEQPYPSNDRGQVLLPSYDFFQQVAQVCEEEKHPIAYFNYQQLSHSFPLAQQMVKTAERLKMPFLAGSAMPVTWRLPDVDIPHGAHVTEAVMVGPSGFRGSPFDALDAMQAMLERRKGGETGVRAVQLLEGDDVWAARKASRFSEELLSSALSRSDTPLGLTVLDGRTQDLSAPGVLEQLVPNPIAFLIDYTDGTKATLLVLDGAIQDYNISSRVEGHGNVSTQFFMTPDPNETFSACLAGKIEQLYTTKSAPYSVRRTLLTTGIMEAAMNSRHRLNARLETPHLAVSYQSPSESQYIRT